MKAQKFLDIFPITDTSTLDLLHEKTFLRQGITRPEEEIKLLHSITDSALCNNTGSLLCCKQDDIPLSAVLFLSDDRTAYYMFGATDPDYRNTGAGTYTLLSAIRHYYEKGLKEIDFLGANSPQRGDYKTSFDADLKPYIIASI